jgi:phage terminase large subunit-like protein
MPSAEPAFRNLHLNQPVEQEARFLNAADWDACGAELHEAIVDLRGRACWGGLDLGSTQDLTALVLVFPDEDGAYDVLPYFWVPADSMRERAERDRVPYPAWREDGYIEATKGRAIDKRFISARIAQLAATFNIRGIAYDRWRIEDLKLLLADEGVEVPLMPWGQGYKDMGPAVDALETAVLQRQLRHGGHPILRWNAANAVVTSDPAGARKLAKDRSRERIDGLAALTMAIGLHQREPKVEPFDIERALKVLTA